MSLLSHVHLTSFVPNVKTWVSSSLGVFLVKKFLLALSNFSYFVPFYPINFLWKSRVPSKVMAFAWLVAYKRVNTNDILQLRRPFNAFSPDWCILCQSREMIDHLFFHCPITLGLWHKIFLQAGMTRVQLGSIHNMIVISFKCFGNSIRGQDFLEDHVSLFVVDCVERKEC